MLIAKKNKKRRGGLAGQAEPCEARVHEHDYGVLLKFDDARDEVVLGIDKAHPSVRVLMTAPEALSLATALTRSATRHQVQEKNREDDAAPATSQDTCARESYAAKSRTCCGKCRG